AAIMLASRAGAHVTVTSRKEEALEKARGLGAHDGVPSGGKLAKRVDVVIETVGQATWAHSMKSLNQAGRLVVAGATTGATPSARGRPSSPPGRRRLRPATGRRR